MKTTFICLANSYKEKNRCIAGVEVLNGEAILAENKPKWIRPVCKTEHGQIPTYLVSKIKLLDLIEIDTTEKVPDGFQSENILFDTDSIRITDTFPLEKLPSLCDTSLKVIFGNKGKAVSSDNIHSLKNSLCMIRVTEFDAFEKDYGGKSQVRLQFEYNSYEYDFPVTDPVFITNIRSNKNLLSKRLEIYLTLSLGIVHEGWHYKLVAGIL